MIRRTILSCGVLLALAACGAKVAGVSTMPAPKTAEQALFETKANLDIAIIQADTYAKLPRCAPGVSPVCSTQPAAARLYGLAKAAVAAVDAGRPVVAEVAALRDPTATDQQKAQGVADAAAAALQRLVGAISVLPQKGEV